jgi:septum formation protein
MIKRQDVKLVLASASPRRRELLEQIGVQFRVQAADIDESVLPGESPGDYTLRVARDKALAVLNSAGSALPVLGADTAVILDGRILGKPGSREEAATMLSLLSGRTHQVYSAVAVAVSQQDVQQRLNVSSVTFADLDTAWIECYIDTGDPMDKAGAYGVQGLAAERISRIDGSFSGVMGLPLYETSQLLEALKCYSRTGSKSAIRA